jgi:nitrate/nitrite-specific signal transduction histidine kinase
LIQIFAAVCTAQRALARIANWHVFCTYRVSAIGTANIPDKEDNMNRRHFLHTSVAVSGMLLGLSRANAQIVGINDAINKSGRQRMLSQRLAKSYLQIGQNIDLLRSKKIFDVSLGLFERQLAELQAFAPTPENKAVLADMSKTWGAYKTVLTAAAPNMRDARSIMSINEDVLALAQTSTVQLEKISGTTAGHLVNVSGRQRMLSQRMAKFYQAFNWGVASPDALTNLAKARTEFVAALTELSASPKNTPAIKEEIELAKVQWVFFDQALLVKPNSVENKTRFADNVATTSERILESMDKITGMYQMLT